MAIFLKYCGKYTYQSQDMESVWVLTVNYKDMQVFDSEDLSEEKARELMSTKKREDGYAWEFDISSNEDKKRWVLMMRGPDGEWFSGGGTLKINKVKVQSTQNIKPSKRK